MTRLSIIIVSYNVKYYLEQCLRSVERATTQMPVQIWVVDNASTDGTLDYLRPRFPHVHFIANQDNKGFSAANNQAIRLSTSQYVLLLNPDTIVGEDVLQGCMDFLDAHPQAGATGGLFGQAKEFREWMNPNSKEMMVDYCSIRDMQINKNTGKKEEKIVAPIPAVTYNEITDKLSEYGATVYGDRKSVV